MTEKRRRRSFSAAFWRALSLSLMAVALGAAAPAPGTLTIDTLRADAAQSTGAMLAPRLTQ